MIDSGEYELLVYLQKKEIPKQTLEDYMDENNLSEEDVLEMLKNKS